MISSKKRLNRKAIQKKGPEWVLGCFFFCAVLKVLNDGCFAMEIPQEIFNGKSETCHFIEDLLYLQYSGCPANVWSISADGSEGRTLYWVQRGAYGITVKLTGWGIRC